MYEVRHAGSKGFGVFAKTRIPHGTRILAERPKFTVRSDREIYPALGKLSEKDRNYLRGLSVNTTKGATVCPQWVESALHVTRGVLASRSRHSSIAEYMTLLAAFRNNCFNIGDGTRAIFHDICRINHSCVPNAQGNFNTALGSFTIHAVKALEPEEEVTISYLDEHGAVKDIRQAQLHQGYGFVCQCPACNDSAASGQESGKRRRDVRKQLMAFAEAATKQAARDLQGELAVLMVLVRMFEQEGLVGRELATMYLSAAEGHSGLGDRLAAENLSARGLEMEKTCLGTDNPLYADSLARMRKSRLAWSCAAISQHSRSNGFA